MENENQESTIVLTIPRILVCVLCLGLVFTPVGAGLAHYMADTTPLKIEQEKTEQLKQQAEIQKQLAEQYKYASLILVFDLEGPHVKPLTNIEGTGDE